MSVKFHNDLKNSDDSNDDMKFYMRKYDKRISPLSVFNCCHRYTIC